MYAEIDVQNSRDSSSHRPPVPPGVTQPDTSEPLLNSTVESTIDSRVKGIGNSIKLNQHLLYHACLEISHLKGVKRSKGQEESQEEKKL